MLQENGTVVLSGLYQAYASLVALLVLFSH
jgi:hypothetical protein